MTSDLRTLLSGKIIDMLAFKYYTSGNTPEKWDKLYAHYTRCIPYAKQMENVGIRTVVHKSLWPIPLPKLDL